MTKTLTEQWRKGTLPEGYYYTKGAFDDDIYISYFDYEIEEDKRLPVKEVLSAVPSYDEYKRLVSNSDESFGNTEQLEKELSRKTLQLEKRLEVSEKEHYRTLEQLRISTKALKKYMTFCRHPAEEALKEMEGVK